MKGALRAIEKSGRFVNRPYKSLAEFAKQMKSNRFSGDMRGIVRPGALRSSSRGKLDGNASASPVFLTKSKHLL